MDNNNLVENKTIKRNKKTKFVEEREKIFNKLYSLVPFDKDNSILYIELVDNQILKNELNNLSNDIKKFYRCSSWGYFASIKRGIKPEETSLFKAIMKQHGYRISNKEVITTYKDIKKKYTKLFFDKI